MRIIILLMLLFLTTSPEPSAAQTPKEMQQQLQQEINELKKQIADTEKEIAAAKARKEEAETIKAMEDDLAMQKQQLSLIEKAAKSMGNIPSSIMNKATKEIIKENDDGYKTIPAKKTALLATIPKETLSKTELATFLTTLNNDLRKKVSAEILTNIQKIISQLENNASKIAFSGVAAWYNKAPAQAALLLLYAASKEPGNVNTLNNLGAVLNLCSKEEKAIPILKYVLQNHPNNSTVLNNLGQAFIGLGDASTAMTFFRQCIQLSPHHPEANATAAMIAEAMGDMDLALEYTEQALKGAFNSERAEFFKNKQKGCNVKVLFDTKSFSKTQYFEPGSIQFPPNCRSWAECESVYPLQQAFNKKISDLGIKYQKQTLDNQLSMAEIQSMGEGPFNNAALFKKEILGNCYAEKKQMIMDKLMSDMNLLVEQQSAEQIALTKQYESELKACPEIGKAKCQDIATYKNCQLKKALDNKYFGLWADLSDNLIAKSYAEDVGYYNSIVYLESVSYTNDKILAQVHGVYTRDLLLGFQSYILSTGCNPASKPNCEQYNPANANNPNSPNFKVPQCPIGIKFDFGAGSVNLSCKTFGIELGRGLKFGYEKDFITKESTLSMGAGVDADIPGIMDASASQNVFVKFDGNNQPIDVGVSGDISAGIKGMTPLVSAGYTMGVNSGFNTSGRSPF